MYVVHNAQPEPRPRPRPRPHLTIVPAAVETDPVRPPIPVWRVHQRQLVIASLLCRPDRSERPDRKAA
jgi:hypothetical protein